MHWVGLIVRVVRVRGTWWGWKCHCVHGQPSKAGMGVWFLLRSPAEFLLLRLELWRITSACCRARTLLDVL
jgi:hypothetical protein